MESKFDKNCIILLNKSKGVSSFGAINKLKRILNCNKVGHGGTLDPMAEGLLIVMVNNATKFSEDLMKKDKEYYVEMALGYETDTYDTEGKIVKQYEGVHYPNLKKIDEIVNEFKGEIEQIPPMYSAIKVKGEKLYDLARKGIEIERKSRKIKINYIENLKYDEKNKILSFIVGVSSGTYIRSLVKDIGDKLGVYATMTKLVRTKIDKFLIENSYKLEEINSKIEVVKIEEILNYEEININEEEYIKIKNGMTVLIKEEKFKNDKKLKLYLNGKFVGVGEIIKINNGYIYIKREKYMI